MLGGAVDANIFPLLLAGARMSAIVMLMPGIGENWVPARLRVGLAVSLAALVAMSTNGQFTAPDSFSAATNAIASETVTGLLFGGVMRFFLAAPQIAGQITSQIGSLSNIFITAGMPMETSSIMSVWLMIGAIVFTFVSGLHYLMIDAAFASYEIIPMATFPLLGDAAQQSVKVFAGVFALGVQMAVPFILLSLLFNLGIGIVNKMLPILPVYFIAMPASILGLIYLIAFAIAPILTAYRNYFQSWLMAPFT